MPPGSVGGEDDGAVTGVEGATHQGLVDEGVEPRRVGDGDEGLIPVVENDRRIERRRRGLAGHGGHRRHVCGLAGGIHAETIVMIMPTA